MTATDDIAVDRFSFAMKAKLAKKRAEGRGGWDNKAECSNEFLSHLLREHVEKGDPVDVGNLAMMIHQRGERIYVPNKEDWGVSSVVQRLKNYADWMVSCALGNVPDEAETLYEAIEEIQRLRAAPRTQRGG